MTASGPNTSLQGEPDWAECKLVSTSIVANDFQRRSHTLPARWSANSSALTLVPSHMGYAARTL